MDKETPAQIAPAESLVECFAALRAATPGPTVTPNSQDWDKLGGAVAFHLIERHADNWADAELMMDEFAASRIQAALVEKDAEIARLESAWHVNTMKRKDAIIAQQEAKNDRQAARIAELEAQLESIGAGGVGESIRAVPS